MSSIEIVCPGQRLSLNPESSGFAHGYGLFETIRLRGGRIELWDAHWRRLLHSARVLGIPCAYGETEALEALKALAKELPAEATIKLSLLKDGRSSKLVIYSRPLSTLPDRIGLHIQDFYPLNQDSLLAGHKTHNYLENLLALEAARELGCFDALRQNTKGQAVEGAISNIFFYRDGSWHTPSLECGPLPGVIRNVMLEAVASVQEGCYQPADLISAEAVFLSNASIGLQPVDWLHHKGREIQLASRKHPSYLSVWPQLTRRIETSSIQVLGHF